MEWSRENKAILAFVAAVATFNGAIILLTIIGLMLYYVWCVFVPEKTYLDKLLDDDYELSSKEHVEEWLKHNK